MDVNPQDSLVTSSQEITLTEPLFPMFTSSLHSLPFKKNCQKKKQRGANQKPVPWTKNFMKICHSSLGTNNISILVDLIITYIENISKDVTISYRKSIQASKIKDSMLKMLSFFHQFYLNIKMDIDDTQYMEKMTTLLTMYIDMEVKSSRLGRENVGKISSKLISALYIFLDENPDYILDALLKARFTMKTYSEIIIPMFNKVSTFPVTQGLTYVRLLLIFRLWKKMLTATEEKNSINKLAVEKLNNSVVSVVELVHSGVLRDVLPVLPEDKPHAEITRYFMTIKMDVKRSIKELMKVVEQQKLNDTNTEFDTSPCSESLHDTDFEDPSDVFKVLTFDDYEGMRCIAEGA